MLLIRVEHKKGNGIFRAVDDNGVALIRELAMFNDIRDRHRNFPTPQEDGMSIERHVEYCGFKSIDQLKMWFNEIELRALIDIGFKVYQIHVSDCKESRNQILYKKSDILIKKDISNLFL
jgi:hypothetical protein